MPPPRETVYGAPNPPGLLFSKGVLHPRTLSEEIEGIIRQIILAHPAPLSMLTVYKELVKREVMKFDKEVWYAREHPTIRAIAGACQYLHFSGQLEGRDELS